MLRLHLRRWSAGIAVAGGFLTAGAVPAVAAGELRITSRDLVVAPGHDAAGEVRISSVGRPRPEDVTVTVDIDLSGLDTVGALTPTGTGWVCLRDADLLRCAGGLDRRGAAPALRFRVAARADVALDTRATLTVRGTSAVGTVVGSTTVTVVEGVDLQTPPEAALTAGPGDPVALPGTVRIGGPVPMRGAVLTLDVDRPLTYAGDHRNCRHREGGPLVCRFDTDLEPGVTYRLSTPLPLRLDERARDGVVLADRLQWWTTDDWARVERDLDGSVPPHPAGTGNPLRLVAQRTPTGADAASWDNWTEVSLTVTAGDGQPRPGTGGGDALLPVTGPGTTLTVGVGGLLLAVGLGGHVLARRRGTRFVA
ncbi:hypothetical protein ACPFP2_28940 [Micromonospora citrea]|uniref:hypothetical protein n=1 Tax=Micromonospora citrea TaxID=47855 RepID=UPI003C40E2CF